jgi:uracil phosphoribosyltransferase
VLAPVPDIPEEPAKKVNVIDHPIAQNALTVLRDKNTPAERFRVMSNLLLTLLTFEATRDLPLREKSIEAAEGTRVGRVTAKPVLFLSLARSGVGLVHNLVDHIPGLLVGSVSIEKSDTGLLEPRLHLSTAPSLDNARVILFQPVVSTGNSAVLALDMVKRAGATDPMLVCFMIGFQGLNRVHSAFNEVPIWTAAIDSDWNSARGPIPGFGRFSERLFG